MEYEVTVDGLMGDLKSEEASVVAAMKYVEAAKFDLTQAQYRLANVHLKIEKALRSSQVTK